MKQFLEAIQEGRTMVFDGAMGTQLDARGIHPGPEWNVKAPDVVADVHRAYAGAGADVLLTNTLTANRLALERAGEADKVGEYNRAGVEVCRQAAEDRAYVAGDIGPTGQLLAPYGDRTEEEFLDAFAEQAETLAGAGADLLIIETMTDLMEAVVAVKACRSVAPLPVIVCIAFDPTVSGPRTMMGNDPQTCARELEIAGADVIGANCGGITPEQMAEVVALMRERASSPLIAQPNAGVPELINGRPEFRLPAEEFAAGALSCVKAGAQLIGGCCGTTPEHIELVRRAVDLIR